MGLLVQLILGSSIALSPCQSQILYSATSLFGQSLIWTLITLSLSSQLHYHIYICRALSNPQKFHIASINHTVCIVIHSWYTRRLPQSSSLQSLSISEDTVTVTLFELACSAISQEILVDSSSTPSLKLLFCFSLLNVSDRYPIPLQSCV